MSLLNPFSWFSNSGQPASLSNEANNVAGSVVDPNGITGGLYNDFMGFTSQDRQFQQEKELLQSEQDFAKEQSDPAYRMSRMKAAGINPLTAAQGISGGSPASSPSAPSGASASPVGNPLDTAVSLGSMLSQNRLNRSVGDANEAKAELDRANASQVEKLARAQMLKTASEFAKNLMAIGIPELGATLMAFDYLSDNMTKSLDYLKAASGIRFFDKQFASLDAEYQLKQKELDSYDERLKMALSEQEANTIKAEKEAKKIEVDTWYQQAKNDLWLQVPGYDLPAFNQLRIVYETYGADSEQYKALEKMITDYSYSDTSGSASAERMFGSSKSPWEMGDKYLHRFVDWIKGNIEDNPDVAKEQIISIMEKLSQEHPTWDRDRIIKELYDLGFSNDDVYRVFNGE